MRPRQLRRRLILVGFGGMLVAAASTLGVVHLAGPVDRDTASVVQVTR